MRRTVVAVAVMAAAVALAAIATGRTGSSPSPTRAGGELPDELSTPAPWPANGAELRARLAAVGLPALAREGTALHTHEHLDLFVDGKRVVVPAGIGIDPYGRFISPIHTHDATGIIHVESPTVRTFTLGEFFDVWGVRFGNGCLGGYCAGQGRVLRVYADRQPVARPRGLPLVQHEEIVVAFGTRRQLPRPTVSYAFPPGL